MSQSIDKSYQLSTAIRFDTGLLKIEWNNDAGGPSPFMLLSYHHDRLLDAAERHGWTQAQSLPTYPSLESVCQKAVDEYQANNEVSECCKIRVLLSKNGQLTASASTTVPLTGDPIAACYFKPEDTAMPPGPVWSIRLDTQPTPTSLFSTTKTTHRDVYDLARSRAKLPPLGQSTYLADVLLYNLEGGIMETSIFNVAFYRHGKWLTPPTSSGCLPGVFRRRLLEHHHISQVEEGIPKDVIQQGEWILLFNAVQGCRLGRIQEC
ncbi:hypothetical protein AX17_002863 [Amanita inopinata Kibby_2008]|nr:hypothetical protein AX17_002863 [Amanita inopinata Kibby_2008]